MTRTYRVHPGAAGRYLAVSAALVAGLALSLGPAPAAHAATLTVTKITDTADGRCDADCSLREAIAAAHATAGDDKINVPAGHYALTLGALQFGDDQAIALAGAAASTTIVDGGGRDRVFQVVSGPVSVAHMTIQNGDSQEGSGFETHGKLTLSNCIIQHNIASENGGGIRNFGDLTVGNCTIAGNTAEGLGGGLYNVTSYATARLTNVTFANNTATSAEEGLGNGGAIYNGGALDLTETTVKENRASAPDGGEGAGVYNLGSLVVTRSTIRDNDAQHNGGGLFNTEGATATLIRSTVSDNQVAINGAGVFNSGRLAISHSTVSGNKTNPDFEPDESDGGGLYNATTGALALNSSTVSDNTARQRGGGILNMGVATLANSTVSGNRARFQGGGIDNLGGTLTLANSTITNNTAEAIGFSGEGGGGGIQHIGFVGSDGAIYSQNTIIAGNADTTGKSPDCLGRLTSQGYNLIGNPAGCTIVGDITGNQLNKLAGLGPLRLNGGPTRTHALIAGSPAIDAANPATCTASDQRGVSRPKDGNGDGTARCDIGSVERKSSSTP